MPLAACIGVYRRLEKTLVLQYILKERHGAGIA